MKCVSVTARVREFARYCEREKLLDDDFHRITHAADRLSNEMHFTGLPNRVTAGITAGYHIDHLFIELHCCRPIRLDLARRGIGLLYGRNGAVIVSQYSTFNHQLILALRHVHLYSSHLSRVVAHTPVHVRAIGLWLGYYLFCVS